MTSKQNFLNYINTLEDVFEEQRTLSSVLKYFSVYENFPAFSKMIDQYVRMLSELVEQPLDTENGNDLEYFIWEEDFGKDFQIGDMLDIDGTPVDVSTPEKLYDYMLAEVTNDN